MKLLVHFGRPVESNEEGNLVSHEVWDGTAGQDQDTVLQYDAKQCNAMQSKSNPAQNPSVAHKKTSWTFCEQPTKHEDQRVDTNYLSLHTATTT